MLEDKVVIVTGGGRGLGQAYAVEAARLGAKVVAGDVLDCGETIRLIEADGGQAIGLELDVTKMGTVSAMAESAVEVFGGINVLINNAALPVVDRFTTVVVPDHGHRGTLVSLGGTGHRVGQQPRQAACGEPSTSSPGAAEPIMAGVPESGVGDR